MNEVPEHLNDVKSPISSVMTLIHKYNELLKENAKLKSQLDIARKLQEKPKLYPPDSDPYFNEE